MNFTVIPGFCFSRQTIAIQKADARSCMKHFIVLLFLLLNPLLSAGVLLKEDFSDTQGARTWTAYTNDDNPFHGWIWENGLSFQKLANGDKTAGGERFSTKPGVFNLKNPRFPMEISFDLFPYDYSGINETWFGIALFAKPPKPDRDEIVVAIKRDICENRHGLNVAVGGKAWLVSDNNLSTPTIFYQWHRIRIRLEREPGKSDLNLFAKTWREGESEPFQWLLQCKLPPGLYPLTGDGAGLAMNALWSGDGCNPQAVFDNILITDNGNPANLFPVKTKKEGDSLRALKIKELEQLFEDEKYAVYAQLFEQFSHSIPDYPLAPELYFNQIIALRKIREWAKARDVANLIPKKFPGTKYAAMMGGANGRTEDDAAIEYAKAITAYYKQDYNACLKFLHEFLAAFPNNWRKKDAMYHICHCHYWMRDYNEMFKAAARFHMEFGKEREAEQILVLEISARIHRREQEQGRDLVNDFRARFPKSKRSDEIAQLELETYFYRENMQETLAGWNDPEKRDLIKELEGEVRYHLEKWIEKNHNTWVVKNMNFLIDIYDATERSPQSLEMIGELLECSRAYPEAQRAIYSNAYGYLMRKGEYEKAEEITGKMIEWEEDPSEAKALTRKLAFILKKLGKTEEARAVLVKYNIEE
jgi:TolA-binding protein